jgi:N-acetylglucosaminyl-diphospho-decaprenol L-rhamnosyltransferase
MPLASSIRPVTAVVVTYQSAHTVDAMFDAARRCHDAGLLDLVVVDNDSRDGTAALLASRSDWTRTILTGRNNGFGVGCNIGAADVASEFTLFLNPDASIEPAELRTLVEFMRAHPAVGVVGPSTLCGAAGTPPVYQVTGPLPTPGSVLLSSVPILESRMLPAPRAILPGDAAFRTGWVCGAVFLIRTALLRRLGGFDARFFLYWEETDLCRRVADAGFEVWATGAAVAKHIAGASSVDDGTRIAGCIGQHYYQSRRHYLVKHHGRFAATVAEAGEFVLMGLRTGVDLLRGRAPTRMLPRLQARLFSRPPVRPSPKGPMPASSWANRP